MACSGTWGDVQVQAQAQAAGLGSGLGLQLLQLTAHIIDGLVELLHPVAQGILNRLSQSPLQPLQPGLQPLQSRLAQHPQMALGLPPPVRLRQQPPAQASGTEDRPGQGTDQDGTAGA